MRLANPMWLIALICLLPLVRASTRRHATVVISALKSKLFDSQRARVSPRKILLPLRLLCVVCLVVALARPQTGKSNLNSKSDGVDIFIVIDTSGSMRGLDFELDGKRVDRLTILKQVVSKFVAKRAGDRLGLIIFGEEAFTQVPLTLDHALLLSMLNSAEIGMAGDATAIGSAIGIAAQRMKDMKSKSKTVIFLTDGRSNAGRVPPLTAAEIAKSYGIKIYTIGVGTKGKVPYLVDSPFGQQLVYQNADIDEETLTEIANKTGGQYFRATDTTTLENIYAEINKLESTEVEVKKYVEYTESFAPFAAAAILLLLAEVGLAGTLLRKIP